MNITFTTYAEKKAKQFLNLLQGYTRGIRITAILLFLLMGVSNAWAIGFNKGNVIFRAQGWNNPTYVYLCVGHNSYTQVWKMTRISNTDLYHVWVNVDNNDNNWWNGCTYFAVIGSTSQVTSGNWGSSSLSTKGNTAYTAAYTAAYDVNNSSGVYFFNKNNSTVKGGSFTIDYKNSHSNIPTLVATQSAKVRNNTSESYSTVNGNWPATLKLKGTYLTGNSASGRSEISSTKSSDEDGKKVYGAVVTGLITHSYSNLSDDYQFDGWIKGNGNTLTSTNTTYSYNITEATTVYACFTRKYAITFGVNGHGSISSKVGSETISSGAKVLGGSGIILTATPEENYRIEGWYKDEACTQSLNNGTNTSYTISSLEENTTVYVKFVEDAYTVTINNDGNGTTSPSGVQTVGKVTGIIISAEPNENFEFVNWTIVDGKGTFGSEQTVANNRFYPSDNATIQANFRSTLTYALSVVPGANIASVTGENNNITLNNTYPITATPNIGFAFSSWTATPAENAIFENNTSASTNVTVSNGSVSVTASATEILSTLTTKNVYDVGNPNYEAPTMSSDRIGIVTTANISSAPTTIGYALTGWILTNCERIDDGANNAPTITIHSNGDGLAAEVTANWEIIRYTITLDRQGGTGGTETVSTTYGSAMPTITVPTREGYLFDGYYDQTGGKGTKYYNADGTNVKNWDKENATLYAKWISHSDCIFFKNNLKWPKVYIYTFTDNAWWHDGNEPGVHPKTNKKEHGQMTKVGQSDIYYYVLTKGNDFSYIAFSSANMSNYDAFYTNAGIYRGDHDVDMTLFIPDAKQTAETHNKTKYYNKGVWMKFNSAQSGYELNIVNGAKVEFTTDKVGGYVFTATMALSGKQNMDITNLQDERKYANNGTMTQKNCTNWQMSEWTWAEQSTWYVQTTSAGDYVFTLDLSDGQVRVSVQYPLAVGDYRLAYQENDGENNTKFHPAQYIRQVTQDTKLDTISFFVNKEGQSPSIVLQKCTLVSNTGVGSWSIIEKKPIDLNKIEQSGVYNVALQQTNEGSHQAKILCNNETYPQAYTGNYYIRTDAANGGWKNYKKETNQMEYTNLNADYDYYYCKWFNNPTGNVRFVVANDYSECVSDTMKTDAFLGGEQLLGESANVRYAWSSKTNTTSRAYLAGSGSNTEYLTINGTNIYTNDASPKPISGKSKFVDQNDWVYALDIKAKHGAVIDVKAVYKSKESTFIENKNIMSTKDGDANYYTLRVIYNFKTNNIVSSWLLQDVQQDMALSADIMMIRNGQDSPNQLTLNKHTISGDPKTVYGVMQFDKSDITDNNKSIEERGLYWISFPFDVKLVDVFGLGEYGTAWIIQYYDGAERAQKGWFQETATFWKYVMPEDRKNFVLEANVGYGLALDIEAIEWPHGIEQQNLYFPSKEKISTIASELTSTTVEVPAHTCIIERDDRKTKDSHWNVIGVPSYADAEDVVSPDGLKFLYEWNPQNNKLSVSNATTHTFKAMHSYMVQFAGKIYWEEKTIAPAALAAKAPAKESTLLQLTLTEGDKQLDQTYVELTDEATAAFDMNMDLTKFFNTGHANIYSCIQTVPVAANMLPVQSVQVPLGIQVVKEGSYTIALPASVDAALVTLIDNQTQTHTCLNTSDYTVTLPAGTYENRFFLAVEPQRVVTSNPTNEQDTAPTVKFIKDGQLYILHQGVIYDAQGRR